MTRFYMTGEKDIVSKFFANLQSVASPGTLQRLDFLEAKDAWDRMNSNTGAFGQSGYFTASYNRNNDPMETGCGPLPIKAEQDINRRGNNDNDDDDGDDQLGQEYEPEIPQPQKHSFQQNLHNAMNEQDHHQTGLDQLPPKQRAMYNAFKKDFDRHFGQGTNHYNNSGSIDVQSQLAKIPIHHQRYVQTHLVIAPNTNIARSNLLRHLLHSLSFIQQLQGKINCYSRLKKTVHYNNFFVFYDQLQQQYRMSSTEFVMETKHLFNEGDNSQIKRRIIRYRKLGERVNGIILGFDKVILLFPDMMTKPRMEDLTDVTYNMICRYVQPKPKPVYSIPAFKSIATSTPSPPPPAHALANTSSTLSSTSPLPAIRIPPLSSTTSSHPFTIANLCSQS
ncbi:hypothetical protein BC941DRAFT_465202 [Chlamydoabsidia padenii]|nr:hypothetical protein BC941DRAFT_465202 [Chlamydoabsidia padenii]